MNEEQNSTPCRATSDVIGHNDSLTLRELLADIYKYGQQERKEMVDQMAGVFREQLGFQAKMFKEEREACNSELRRKIVESEGDVKALKAGVQKISEQLVETKLKDDKEIQRLVAKNKRLEKELQRLKTDNARNQL